jgi:uncharacterized protein (DUF427 family)
MEIVPARVRVEFAGRVIADTTRAVRVLETASPPTYYLHPDDVARECLLPSDHGSFCEWKGRARYYNIVVDEHEARDAAWTYPDPPREFEALRGHLAFYAQRVDRCLVGDHVVQPQPGRFYGGWITPELVGPFKGAPGTEHW